jgi:hypothetical protein
MATSMAKCYSDVLITESFIDTPLKEALNTLNKKYDLKIAYGDHSVSNIILNVEIQSLSVYETFQAILESTSLTFELLNEGVIIVKKKAKSENIDQSTFTLIGVIQDASSGERLPYAYISMGTKNRNLTTNVDGYFTISGLTLPAILNISYLGYQDTTLLIDDRYVNRRLYINLISNPKELEEVVISNKLKDDFEVNESIGKVDLNPKLSYSMPSAGEIDLMRTIQLLPGINATNEFSSGLAIQGGNTNQNLFLYDGFTIYHMDHFFGYFSAINPYAIKSVQLYKGGYDARYGGRVSGIIDISGKEGNLNKISGSLGINLLSINASLEIPLKPNRSSLFFAGRRSYTDIVGTTLFEKIIENFASTLSEENQSTTSSSGWSMGSNSWMMGHNRNTQNTVQVTSLENEIKPEFYYTDLNLKISTKVGLKNHVSISIYDSNDILNFKKSRISSVNDTLTISGNTLGLVNWGNIGSSIKWSRLWNQSHYTNALVSYSRYQSVYDEVSTNVSMNLNQESIIVSSTIEQSNSIQDVTLKIDHEWFLPNEQLIRLGMQSSILGTVYRSKTDDTTFVDQTELNQGLISLYGLNILQPLKGLSLNLGLRSNYYSKTGKWYLEPRISVSHQVTSQIRLKGAYGIYYQFINQSMTKNALQGSRDFWLLADDLKIPVQRAKHFSSGLDYYFGSFIFNAEYFKKDFDGLLEYAFSNGGLVTEYDNYEDMFFEGSGKSEGIELLLKKSGKYFNAWIGYTYSKVKYLFDELNGGEEFFADHDQRHEVNIYGSYKFGKFELFSTWIYGSGTPYSQTSDLKSNEAAMNDFDVHVIVLNIDEKNKLRFPPYHRLDVGAKYEIQLKKIDIISALSIFNLYNRQNIIDYRFNTILMGHSSGHGMSDPIIEFNTVSSMGITPNISVTLIF